MNTAALLKPKPKDKFGMGKLRGRSYSEKRSVIPMTAVALSLCSHADSRFGTPIDDAVDDVVGSTIVSAVKDQLYCMLVLVLFCSLLMYTCAK
jgi:hypothetical protein